MPKNSRNPRKESAFPGRRDFLRTCGIGLTGVALGGGALSGCSGNSGAANYPDRPIQMIVAYAPGGGTDVGARILQPILEKELGAEIQIINRPGGGGWAGWNDLVNADPNGYTIGFINTPNFITGYLDPRLGRTDLSHKDFTLIGNQVTDFGGIAIHPNDNRFDSIEGMMSHAEQHPLIVTSTGVGSDDHFASLQLSDGTGAQFDVLHNEGSSDSVSDLLGRNVDAVFANVGELKAQHDEGKVRVIAVMKEGERSPHLPDVPTLAEAGFEGVESWSSRGIAAPANLDPKIRETLVTACRTAIEDQDHVDELASQGLQVDYLGPDAYAEMIERDDQMVRDLGEKYIWGSSNP